MPICKQHQGVQGPALLAAASFLHPVSEEITVRSPELCLVAGTQAAAHFVISP